MKRTGAGTASRDDGLDVLRGIAILLVLFRHPVIHGVDAGVLAPIAAGTERFGWTGVDLFFVLSGFLIGGLLFKELRTTSRLDVRRFLIRRGLKIWPGYFALLAVAFVQEIRHTNCSPAFALREFLPNLVHLQNYLGSPAGQTWSLAIEEHFYFFLPLLLVGLTWRKPKPCRAITAFPYIAVSFAVICLGLRYWTQGAAPFQPTAQLSPTHLRMDSLFWGVLLAYMHQFHPVGMGRLFRHRKTALACGFALIAPMFYFELSAPFTHILGFTMLSLGYGCILMAFVYAPEDSGLLSRFIHSPAGRGLGTAGMFSYSIYLWHVELAQLPLIERFHQIVSKDAPAEFQWIAATLLYLGLAMGVGVMMAKLIEEPALALRARLFPSGAKELATFEYSTGKIVRTEPALRPALERVNR